MGRRHGWCNHHSHQPLHGWGVLTLPTWNVLTLITYIFNSIILSCNLRLCGRCWRYKPWQGALHSCKSMAASRKMKTRDFCCSFQSFRWSNMNALYEMIERDTQNKCTLRQRKKSSRAPFEDSTKKMHVSVDSSLTSRLSWFYRHVAYVCVAWAYPRIHMDKYVYSSHARTRKIIAPGGDFFHLEYWRIYTHYTCTHAHNHTCIIIISKEGQTRNLDSRTNNSKKSLPSLKKELLVSQTNKHAHARALTQPHRQAHHNTLSQAFSLSKANTHTHFAPPPQTHSPPLCLSNCTTVIYIWTMIYIHIYLHMNVYIYIRINMHICVYIHWSYIYIYEQIYTCSYIYIYTYAHIHIHIYIYIYIYIWWYIYTYIYIYIYMYWYV